MTNERIDAIFAEEPLHVNGAASEPEREIAPPLRTLEDMYALGAIERQWIVGGLLAQGTFNILAGAPKAGKSVFARGLMAAVLQGREFLDRSCAHGTVLLYSLEDPEDIPGPHFQELGVPVTAPLWWRGRLEVPASWPFLELLLQDIAMVEPSLVVIDTLFQALAARDTNDYAHMQALLQPVARVAKSTGAAILALYHTNKTSTGYASSIMGSTAIRGNTDVNIVLHHDEENQKRLLRSEGRIGTHFDGHELALVDGWPTLGDRRFAKENKDLDTAMFDILTQRGSMNQKEWLAACNLGSFHLKRLSISRLVDDGKVGVTSGAHNQRIYNVLYGF